MKIENCYLLICNLMSLLSLCKNGYAKTLLKYHNFKYFFSIKLKHFEFIYFVQCFCCMNNFVKLIMNEFLRYLVIKLLKITIKQYEYFCIYWKQRHLHLHMCISKSVYEINTINGTYPCMLPMNMLFDTNFVCMYTLLD